MTQEEKDLLFKDLCARLPYGVKVILQDGTIGTATGYNIMPNVGTFITIYFNQGDIKVVPFETIKPYLRPISSMTKKEKEEMKKYTLASGGWRRSGFDWLNAHYFDYRGFTLIGIVLEAPKGMYKY